MGSRTTQHTTIAGILGGLALLAAVGYADYITGYELTFFLFYLLPILFVQRRLGPGFAFVTALISTALWLFVNLAAGEHYPDLLTLIWNTGIRLSAFLLVIILFSTRDHLKQQVEQRTERLQQEIRERSRLEKEILEIAESEQQRSRS